MYTPDILAGKLVIEIAKNVSAVRSVREGLLQLAKYLADEVDKEGYLILADSKISEERLHDELGQFMKVLLPDISKRIRLLTTEQEEFESLLNRLPDNDRVRLLQEARSEETSGLRRPDMQAEVVKMLLLRWIRNQEPVTASQLVGDVGTNFRTVKAAIAKLGPAIMQTDDKHYGFAGFPQEAWNKLTADSRESRATEFYVDISNQPRSPESLRDRIRSWARSDIGIGGVIGASWHYSDLDIVGSPRLDICVHAPKNQVKPLRIKKLDPGLERTDDHHRPVRLAIHYLRRAKPCFEITPDGDRIADPVECLLDLNEARLDYQFNQFVEHLTSREGKYHGDPT